LGAAVGLKLIKDTGMQIRAFCAPVNQTEQRTALPVHGGLRTWQGDLGYRICVPRAGSSP